MALNFLKNTQQYTAPTEGLGQNPLLVFDTHPIQYRSPVFQELARKVPNFSVFYFNSSFNAKKWWFHEVGKTPKQDFNLDLQSGFKNETLDTNLWKPWELYSKFKSLLQKKKPRAVLIYGYYLPEHWALQAACHKLRIPLLFIGESFTEGNSALRKMVKGPLVHFFFGRVAHFIAIGDKTHAFYRSWDIPKQNITLAKYCVDTNFFFLEKQKAAEARSKIRKELGIPENAFISLFVGRLFDRKRPEDVLAIHRWYRDNPDYHSIIVGNGPMEEVLRTKSQELKRVHLVGFKNQAEIRDFYYASDILIVPSEYETWGLVINEAFSCGIPAIVTSTCGASGDLVLHGDTGFSYPVGVTARAISFLDRLVKNPQQAKTMGSAAQKLVRTQYSPELFADAILRAFRSVTEKGQKKY